VSAGTKPVNLFISTAKSTYTLILKRVDMPADTIVLKDRGLQQAATRLERSGGSSPSHVRALKQMLTAMASDRLSGDVRVEEVNRPVQLWTESRFTMLRLYESRGLIGEKYLLTNISNEAMVLAEQEFDRDQGDVLGVSIESHNLRPGESTNVFVLRQRN
jgi:conjugal transfer pilus assembly protein TraK